MAELQQGLWVVKTEERYEPTFSYRWDLVEAWLPEAVGGGPAAEPRGRARPPDRALRGRRRLHAPARLRRVFGVPAAEVAASVARLTRAGTLRDAVVDGWPGRWLLHQDAAAR